MKVSYDSSVGKLTHDCGFIKCGQAFIKVEEASLESREKGVWLKNERLNDAANSEVELSLSDRLACLFRSSHPSPVSFTFFSQSFIAPLKRINYLQ